MVDETTCAAGMTDGGGGSEEEMDDDDEENDDEGDDEETLEERVQAMQDAFNNEGRSEEDGGDASSTAHNMVHTDKYSKSTTRSRAQASSASLVTVLEQALQTKDNLMLENVLRIYDFKVIDETCRRLSPTKVFSFLFLLVEKFEKRPMRGANLCVWIKFLLMNHTAYLMTAPDVIQKLSALYQSFDARLKVFPQLHKLNGRLNLVLGQIAGRANATSIDETPQMVYHEEDENEKDDDDDDDDDGEEDEEELEEENENDMEDDS
jgi:U3 small nucleolar RNA-associated protein 5